MQAMIADRFENITSALKSGKITDVRDSQGHTYNCVVNMIERVGVSRNYWKVEIIMHEMDGHRFQHHNTRNIFVHTND